MEQATAAIIQHISEAKARTTLIRLTEDDFQRHDQPEEETYVGTFDVCSLEDVEESKNDARQEHDCVSVRTNSSYHDETVRRNHG